MVQRVVSAVRSVKRCFMFISCSHLRLCPPHHAITSTIALAVTVLRDSDIWWSVYATLTTDHWSVHWSFPHWPSQRHYSALYQQYSQLCIAVRCAVQTVAPSPGLKLPQKVIIKYWFYRENSHAAPRSFIRIVVTIVKLGCREWGSKEHVISPLCSATHIDHKWSYLDCILLQLSISSLVH